MTISEKILARKAHLEKTSAGNIVECEIDLVMSTDNTARILPIFYAMGGQRVWDGKKLAIPIDHWVPADSDVTASNHCLIRDFVKEQNIENFFDVKEGVCHQVLPEKGLTRPGMLIVGKDSHTTTYGAFGAFATGMGETDVAAIYIDGKTWFKVPHTIKITLNGKIKKGVVGKDIILYLLGQLGIEYANYQAIEFYGDAIAQLSIDDRMSICNMAMEMGAKAAIIPPDQVTKAFLDGVGATDYSMVYADPDAKYIAELTFDISDLEPQIAAPGSPGNAFSIKNAPEIKVDQVYLGSCTNGRLSDIRIAAEYLKGKKVAPNVRMYVSPASRKVYLDAVRAGYIETLIEAGAIILNPTCGACLGGQMGLLAPNEVCVSTCNRNYSGRMGSAQANIYLSGALVAAACAAAGYIAKPEVSK